MNRDRHFLLHIQESIAKIDRYTREGKDAFMADIKTQDAVIRNFEIIGEATKRLSATAKAQRPEVPWRDVAGLRDILIHDYEGVDHLEVWNIVEHHLPRLREAVKALLDQVS
jgi:uncharacterized protein with HEPN domain